MRSTPSSRSFSITPSPYIITLSVRSTFLQTLRHSPRPSLAELPTEAEVFTSHQGIHSGVEASRIDPCQDEGPQWNSCVGAPPFLNRLCLRAHHRPWRTHTYVQVLRLCRVYAQCLATPRCLHPTATPMAASSSPRSSA